MAVNQHKLLAAGLMTPSKDEGISSYPTNYQIQQV